MINVSAHNMGRKLIIVGDATMAFCRYVMVNQLLTAAYLGSAVPAFAQQKVDPKPEYFLGDGDVDIRAGVYMYSNVDLRTGPAVAEGGLEFKRVAGVRREGASGPNIGHSLEAILYRDRYRYDPQGEGVYNYAFYVIFGSAVVKFNKDYSGTIDPQDPRYGLLSWGSEDGPYLYKSRDGTSVNISAVTTNCASRQFQTGTCAPATTITRPNGIVTTMQYRTFGGNPRVRLATTNRGYGMGLEYDSAGRITKVCALNLTIAAHATATADAPCPAGVRAASYAYTTSSQGIITQSSFTDPIGNVTTYTYNNNTGDGAIATITTAGSATPDLSIGYTLGKVTSLTYGNNAVWSYSYQNPGADPDYFNNEWTRVKDPLNNETYHAVLNGPPSYVVDPIGRRTTYRYVIDRMPSLLERRIDPELNETRYTYDALDHVTETRRVAKPGSGLADIVTAATYPTGCATQPTCDKPLTQTDARGAVTSYTYNATHGGVLTETGPAVGGVQPVKRYAYAQRYAWLSNGAGGYVQANSPIWLLTEERTCRTTATSGNACAGGSSDEIVTAYDYGPNSGPNNLLMRGVAVTANGQTLRTCYRYDTNGWRISETKPRAGLTSCP